LEQEFIADSSKFAPPGLIDRRLHTLLSVDKTVKDCWLNGMIDRVFQWRMLQKKSQAEDQVGTHEIGGSATEDLHVWKW
jgi:hypothetical protein